MAKLVEVKRFAVTSTFFATAQEALDQIEKWDNNGSLVAGTKIVEVKKKFNPVTIKNWDLKEEKL